MKNTWVLFIHTLPFVWMRMLVNVIFAVGAIICLGLLLGLGILLTGLFNSGAFFIAIIVLAIAGLFAAYRLLQKYVLYLLKAAHIAVLIELIDHGEVPKGKGQIAYGKEKVTSMFKATSVFFAVDQLVSASVKQIHKWLMRFGQFLNAIPGAKIIINLASMILGIALNYIDEAILSRVIKRKKENQQTDIWKDSADGVVLYAQCWKGMLMTATGVAIFTIVLTVASFLLFLFPLLYITHWLAGESGFVLNIFAFIAAYVASFAIKAALIDPVATIAMIRSYHTQTSEAAPSFDLKQKLLSASRKFKSLVEREGSGIDEYVERSPIANTAHTVSSNHTQ